MKSQNICNTVSAESNGLSVENFKFHNSVY